MRYQWILFDADETLFEFDSFSGLKQMFTKWNIGFTENDFIEYQSINQPLWVAYQNGKLTATEVQQKRFATWADKLQVPAKQLNSEFMTAMSEVSQPMVGAKDILDSLQGKVKFGIITNGFIELQQRRLERTGMTEYFDIVVISEQVGVAKPDPKIFAHALNLMGNPAKQNVLMVGDNPDSDILGGINAGLDTCWFNTADKLLPMDITPTYQIKSLTELLPVIN